MGNKPRPAPRRSLQSDPDEFAGVTDHKTEENKDMTDSGIVYDSDTLKLSVKDKASRFGSKEEVNDERSSPKSSSLRGGKLPDVKDTETPKRPRSMLAVLENNPGLKNQKSDDKTDTTPKIKQTEEEKDDKGSKEPESPTDQGVMV